MLLLTLASAELVIRSRTWILLSTMVHVWSLAGRGVQRYFVQRDKSESVIWSYYKTEMYGHCYFRWTEISWVRTMFFLLSSSLRRGEVRSVLVRPCVAVRHAEISKLLWAGGFWCFYHGFLKSLNISRGLLNYSWYNLWKTCLLKLGVEMRLRCRRKLSMNTYCKTWLASNYCNSGVE